MDFFSILSLLGGLALFLYGMDTMGDSLKKLAGRRLETVLSKLTSNRFKGFLLGFFVTAVIQSSSATTVMLVGFVNSGIMKLGQTIGIIMGANVGTTVTAWLLSLSGINGDSFWVRIFKPSSFTPVLAAVGFMMTLASSDSKKNMGRIFLGFAILMFGMDAMSASVEGLKNSESFSQMLLMFSNPVMGILVGTLLTAIIQSSSASVGVLQALSLSIAIPFSTAIPIILGQNIGTTITPILSSITGNTESKRVAFSCLYIKMIGVVIVGSVFYFLNYVMDFAFMSANVNVMTIAVVHTMFNIISTVILLPFGEVIETLAVKTIKGKSNEEADVFSALDERFMTVPSFAVEKCRELVSDMAKISENSILDAAKLIGKYDPAACAKILKSEELVDKYEDKISTYLVKLSGVAMSESDSKMVTELLHVIGDVERMSDHAVNIVDVAKEMHEKEIDFSAGAKHDIEVISAAVCEVLHLAVDALVNENLETAKKVEPLEQVIDRLKLKIKDNHIRRLKDGDCTVEFGFILSDLLTNYERIADHCSNIAVCLLEIAHGSFETHEYLNHVKSDGENDFDVRYREYKKKYTL